MQKLIKYILGFLGILVFVPLVYTVLYYFIEIRPHNDVLLQKIEAYEPLTQNLRLMQKIALEEEGRGGMVRYVSHSLAVDNIESGFRNYWHLVGLHWQIWIQLLYTDKEIYQLWLARAPYGQGLGMNKASIYHFNKPIEQLSCYQLAQLVAMVRAPTRFKPGSDRSEQRIKNRAIANVCSG